MSDESSDTHQLSDAVRERHQLLAWNTRNAEAELWRQFNCHPSAAIAEIGCNRGSILLELAQVADGADFIVGVESDEIALSQAQAHIKWRLIPRVHVVQGTANETNLPPASFDLVMQRNLLLENGGSESAILLHLRSLLKIGGYLYLAERDIEAARICPEDSDLEDLTKRWEQMMRAQGNDLRVGSKLSHLLSSSDLEVVHVDARVEMLPVNAEFRGAAWDSRYALIAAGLADESDIQRWDLAFERWHALRQSKFCFHPLYLAVGRRRR